MMKTVFVAAAAMAVSATVASANDFDNTGVTLTAETGKLEFVVEGTADNGYDSLTVGYEALSYGAGANTTGVLDVYATTHRANDEFSIGAEYTMTYSRDALSLYGSADAEYFVDSEVLAVTPTIGASYVAAEAVTVWGEVGYTWEANNDWAKQGGLAEVGVDFAVAENIALTPSVRYNFDGAAADNTQAHLGVKFSF
jgi:hypothetical protein